ncbi:MAG: Lrp/AsnC family transcriptional regulator [Spirochaetaceae bacterium]
MKFDKTNLAIIRHLRDGRKSFNTIAGDLQITENTVRSRVSKMTEEGILQIIGLVNPEKLAGHHTVVIGVKLTTPKLFQKGEEFIGLRGVTKVLLVTGKYDIIIEVLLKEGFGLLEFYEEEFVKMSDVQTAETFVVFKSFNNLVPYVL